MTDNEIVKALECCANGSCKECPCSVGAYCLAPSDEKIIDLINRQKEENERLKNKILEDDRLLNDRVQESINAVCSANQKYVDALEKAFNDRTAELQTAKAEIERLQKYNTEVAYKHYNDGINDGIKEFANRLKDKSLTKWDYHDAVDIAEIDNLVKEMTEGKPCTEDADCSTCEYCYFDGEYNECAVNGIKPIIRNWRGKI